MPEGWKNPRLCLPGVVAEEAEGFEISDLKFENSESKSLVSSLSSQISNLSSQISNLKSQISGLNGVPLLILVDDSEFTARTLGNFLWVTFTRSNPAADISGFGAFSEQKHWGCTGPLLIDARIKPHHAPPLVTDSVVAKKIDALAARGGPLAKWL